MQPHLNFAGNAQFVRKAFLFVLQFKQAYPGMFRDYDVIGSVDDFENSYLLRKIR